MIRHGISYSIAIGIITIVCATATAQQKTEPKPAAKPKTTAAQEKALENYRTICQPCHGPEGNALIKEMSLADGEWKHGATPQAVAKSISEGVKGTAMVGFKSKFSREEIAELAKLVRSFDPKLKSAAGQPAKKK
jgi:mono/diheme cytochrome c family protein